MNTSPLRSGRSCAFTLLELLTVLAIIAILMGLLFPVLSSMMDRARKTEAKAATMSILTAVTAYHTEYGRYPSMSVGNVSSNEEDVIVGDPEAGTTIPNAALFNILRARADGNGNPDHAANPKKLVFFTGAMAKNTTAPKGGFADTPGTNGVPGAFYDPWGGQYCVVIDANYDNVLGKIPHTDFTPETTPVRAGVAAFSLGKDGILGSRNTNRAYQQSDDVVSWQ